MLHKASAEPCLRVNLREGGGPPVPVIRVVRPPTSRRLLVQRGGRVRICGLIKLSGGVLGADGHILRVPRVRRCAPQSEGYFEPLSKCEGPYYLRVRAITNDSRRRV